jgi:hypothetical protein
MNDRDNNNSVVIRADDDLVNVFLGAANVPARIELTTGGNPGPVIRLDGTKNALQFTRSTGPSGRPWSSPAHIPTSTSTPVAAS